MGHWQSRHVYISTVCLIYGKFEANETTEPIDIGNILTVRPRKNRTLKQWNAASRFWGV